MFSKGARVSQSTYGAGTITDTDSNHTVIDFDNHGPRKFVTSLVVLESTNEPAPERAKPARRAKRATPPAPRT